MWQKFRRPLVVADIKKPNFSIFEIFDQFPIFNRIHRPRPNNIGSIDVRLVVNPFLIWVVIRSVSYNDKMTPLPAKLLV